MAGKEFTLDSGAKLFVTQLSLSEGLALHRAVVKCMLDNGLFGRKDREVTMRLFIDPAVMAAYEPAQAKTLYNGRKLDAALFDDPRAGEAASGDMMVIFDTVVAYNSRFFPKASSASSAQPQGGSDQPSK
jgi:hypothetical protein